MADTFFLMRNCLFLKSFKFNYMVIKVVCINNNGWVKDKSYLFGLIKREIYCGEKPCEGEKCTVDLSQSENGYYFIIEYADLHLATQFVICPETLHDEITFEKIKEEISIPQSVN